MPTIKQIEISFEKSRRMGKESSIICSSLNKEYNYLMNFEMHDNIKNNILCKIQF